MVGCFSDISTQDTLFEARRWRRVTDNSRAKKRQKTGAMPVPRGSNISSGQNDGGQAESSTRGDEGANGQEMPAAFFGPDETNEADSIKPDDNPKYTSLGAMQPASAGKFSRPSEGKPTNSKIFHFHLATGPIDGDDPASETLICRLVNGEINYILYVGTGSSGTPWALSALQLGERCYGRMRRQLPLTNTLSNGKKMTQKEFVALCRDIIDKDSV